MIGEALLQLAERSAQVGHRVTVIMQDHVGVKGELARSQRGAGIRFLPLKALTSSASNLFLRGLDAAFFSVWVLLTLVWIRPQKVYVSTDPPILVPFLVMVYARLFRAEFIYHLQDIHPEATNVVMPLPDWILKFLVFIDSITMRRATCLITITEVMANEIRSRSQTQVKIIVLDNPAVSFRRIDTSKAKVRGFSFCGNAGRLQRIPLLLTAFANYYDNGGQLPCVFAGGGVYADALREFSGRYPLFEYRGLVSSYEAAQINVDMEWALLPIEDEVTRFAFPSKSSSYVLAGAKILAICGVQTSVAHWIDQHGVGLVVEPESQLIASVLFAIDAGRKGESISTCDQAELKSKLECGVFVTRLIDVVIGTD